MSNNREGEFIQETEWSTAYYSLVIGYSLIMQTDHPVPIYQIINRANSMIEAEYLGLPEALSMLYQRTQALMIALEGLETLYPTITGPLQ